MVAGFFNGVGGADGGNYDANGHYIKTMLGVQAGGGTLDRACINVLGNLIGKLTGAVTSLGNGNTNIAPCPGGGSPPAPDNTNAWTSPDLLPGAGTLCLPAGRPEMRRLTAIALLLVHARPDRRVRVRIDRAGIVERRRST